MLFSSSGAPSRSEPAIASQREFCDLYKIAFGYDPNADAFGRFMPDGPTTADLAARIFTSTEYRLHIFWGERIPAYGYDGLPYLARSLSGSNDDKRACFFFNGAQVFQRFDSKAVDAMLTSELILWETTVEQRAYDICVGFSRWHKHEGDLKLYFRLAQQPLFEFAFNIVPGRLLGSSQACALLLSRMQGAAGVHALTLQAAKDLHGVAPQTALMAAVNGLAQALEIAQVGAVSAANQISFDPESAEHFLQGYDRFLQAIGAVGPIDGFFLIAAPFADKPLATVKASHRSRAKARQRIKTGIAEAVKQATGAVLRPAPETASRVAAPGSLIQQAFNADVNALCATFDAERRRMQAEAQRAREDGETLRRLQERNIGDLANLIARPNPIAKFVLARRLPYLGRWVRRWEMRRLTRYGFDPDYYLAKNPDVRRSGAPPVEHYVLHGRDEGRAAFFKPGQAGGAAPGSRALTRLKWSASH